MLTYEILPLEYVTVVRVWNTAHTDYIQHGFHTSRWAWLNRYRLARAKRALETLICVHGSRLWTKEYLES